eukprot:scaffold219869_cov42-Prasinocladus_malaysianus.AAC.2
MVMVRAPLSPRQSDDEAKRRPRRGPAAVALTAVATAGVVLFLAGTTRWRSSSRHANYFEDESIIVRVNEPPALTAHRYAWIPRMPAGLVAAKQDTVPEKYQCWSPLCDPCKVADASFSALAGLRIYVLTYGGKLVGGQCDNIQQTQ